MPDNSVDAVVTDPPYGLNSELSPKELAGMLAAWSAGEPWQRKGGGFMGREWDSSVPGPDVWREVFRVLKPGGHALVFAGTRTYDLMVLALRLAGFECRDCLAYHFASGFPKSLDVSAALDRRAGAKREVVGPNPTWRDAKRDNRIMRPVSGDGAKWITAPASESARQWEGFGTSLKPAFEPIALVRKPLAGTVAENVLSYGTGALNIGGCRIGTTKDVPASPAKARINIAKGAERDRAADTSGYNPDVGRWPANVLLGDSEVAEMLDAQAGERPGVGKPRVLRRGHSTSSGIGYGSTAEGGAAPVGFQDSSTNASRFFFTAKPAKRERHLGCRDLYWRRDKSSPTGVVRVSREEWEALPEAEQAHGNIHPTVKPLSAMRWLVRLVTPPGGTVLDPFVGSGTTAMACEAEGFECVAVDLYADHLDVAACRIGSVHELGEKRPPIAKAKREVAPPPTPTVPRPDVAPRVLDLFSMDEAA
jgi:site-specific DNA-methyltransferase (adenine-specific)